MFHDKEELVGSFDDFVELDDMRVPDNFQNMNFPGHSLDIVHIRYLVLLQNFDRHFLLRKQVNTFFHFAKRTLTKSLGDPIGAYDHSFVFIYGLGCAIDYFRW